MEEINNKFYDSYGLKWYTAQDDPVALLRAEGRLKQKWIHNRIPKTASILDVGCGAGFLCNYLSENGYDVTGLDASLSSLQVAAEFDQTKNAKYVYGDAYQLPFRDNTFDVVTNMDFLEHIDNPQKSIAECARVLKPGGLFFFHTFNRNFVSYLVVIKLVEWLVKNTPPNMHLLKLFIKPNELKKMCQNNSLEIIEWQGIRPKFNRDLIKLAINGEVPNSFEFTTSQSLLMSYIGYAKKY